MLQHLTKEGFGVHASNANTVLALLQRGVTPTVEDWPMDPVWDRLDAELKRRKRNWSWLATRLGYSRARCANWKARGIPLAEYPALAVAFGESADWVAGVAEARGTGGAEPSPMAARLAQEFDQIGDSSAQLDAFAKAIAIITRAREN